MISATRSYEIDMGHALPTHGGKCHRPHGHRYRIEGTWAVEDDETDRPGESDDGMVMDFAVLKEVMADVLERFDHCFVMSEDDGRLNDAVDAFGVDVIVVGFIPTAENLACAWAEMLIIEMMMSQDDPPKLMKLAVWETPNGMAEWSAP